MHSDARNFVRLAHKNKFDSSAILDTVGAVAEAAGSADDGEDVWDGRGASPGGTQ